MEFTCAKEISFESQITKAHLISIFEKALDAIAARPGIKERYISCILKVVYEGISAEFERIDAISEHIPPSAQIEEFSFFLGHNLHKLKSRTAPELSLYISFSGERSVLKVRVSTGTAVLAEEFALDVSEALRLLSEHFFEGVNARCDNGKSCMQAEKTQDRNLGKESLKWAKIGVVTAIIVGLVSIAVPIVFELCR